VDRGRIGKRRKSSTKKGAGKKGISSKSRRAILVGEGPRKDGVKWVVHMLWKGKNSGGNYSRGARVTE